VKSTAHTIFMASVPLEVQPLFQPEQAAPRCQGAQILRRRFAHPSVQPVWPERQGGVQLQV
jgi:hypothetical protein